VTLHYNRAPMCRETKARRFRFPATRRLKLAREFERVRIEGRTVRGSLLFFGVLPLKEEKFFRIGLVTSRRIGGAVVRNRLRRRLREIVRRRQHELVNGVWLVVVARSSAAEATTAMLESEWCKLTERAGLVSAGSS
jgi:ribonuclease P protein component